MPIPAPPRYSRTKLTKEQQQDQLAACYGVNMPMELSHEEVERMRQIVQQHDSSRKPMQTIDLNNPPKENYRYQKFPKMVYDLEKSKPGHLVSKVVRSDSELALSLEEGWSEEAPPFGNTPEETLSASYQAQVAQLEKELAEARKRGPGRPPKVSEVA